MFLRRQVVKNNQLEMFLLQLILLVQFKKSIISLGYLIAETSLLLLIAKDHKILIRNQI